MNGRKNGRAKADVRRYNKKCTYTSKAKKFFIHFTHYSSLIVHTITYGFITGSYYSNTVTIPIHPTDTFTDILKSPWKFVKKSISLKINRYILRTQNEVSRVSRFLISLNPRYPRNPHLHFSPNRSLDFVNVIK